MSRAFTDKEKLEIKQKILAEAKELFKQKPYKEVKINDITKKLGIAKGSFYNFFESKESLLIVILAEIEKQLHQQIITLMETESNKKSFLIKLMQRMAAECRNNQLFKAILNEESMYTILKSIPEKQKTEMFKADEALLIQLVANDLKLKVPLNVAVDMLRAIFYLQAVTDNIESDIETYNHHMINAVVNEIFV